VAPVRMGGVVPGLAGPRDRPGRQSSGRRDGDLPCGGAEGRQRRRMRPPLGPRSRPGRLFPRSRPQTWNLLAGSFCATVGDGRNDLPFRSSRAERIHAGGAGKGKRREKRKMGRLEGG